MNLQVSGRYYRHSGAFGFRGLIYMLALGAIGAVVLGLIYAYAIEYIPLVYLNMLLVIGYGTAIGACVHFGAKWGKVRNGALLLLGGAVAGLLAEYTNWVWWIFAYSKQEVFVFMPADLWQVIQDVNEQGAWSIFDSTPTGWELWAYWGMEAVVIVGMSIFAAWVTLSSLPFCEACGRWVDGKDTLSPLDAVDDRKTFKSKLELGDYAPLKALKRLPEEGTGYTAVILQNCSGCTGSNFLTVQAVTVSRDKKGKISRSTANILQNLVLNADTYRSIRSALLAS